jgi:hypothetical protein
MRIRQGCACPFAPLDRTELSLAHRVRVGGIPAADGPASRNIAPVLTSSRGCLPVRQCFPRGWCTRRSALGAPCGRMSWFFSQTPDSMILWMRLQWVFRTFATSACCGSMMKFRRRLRRGRGIGRCGRDALFTRARRMRWCKSRISVIAVAGPTLPC